MPIVKKKTQRGDVTCLRSHSQDFDLHLCPDTTGKRVLILSFLGVGERNLARVSRNSVKL